MPNLKLRMDIGELTLGDLEIIEGLAHGESSIRECRKVLERYVAVEGDEDMDLRSLPATALVEMIDKITSAYGNAIEAAQKK